MRYREGFKRGANVRRRIPVNENGFGVEEVLLRWLEEGGGGGCRGSIAWFDPDYQILPPLPLEWVLEGNPSVVGFL